MPQRKIIAENLEALNSLKDLAESYEEIAVIRMQKIKTSVLKARDFLADLSDVFVDLKSSYNREVLELISKRKKGDKSILPLLQKNGKTLLVYLASNGRLYGAVTQRTYKLFIQSLKKTDPTTTDILIIGTAGKEMYEGSGVARPFTFFDIPDVGVELKHIKGLMQKFLQYDRVQVYYGKFDNVINQTPIGTSITGDNIFESEVVETVNRDDRFIFEPILEKIFYFFETQIIANLFSQTLLENQLARHASRVNAMEEALIHIEEESKKLTQAKNQLKHQMQNKKQLETISGLAIWG
ncbi:MAG: F0F1 ATP synthase subunit gamma [Candidatus Levybacteria bacterium]|nr:F0F1 ATP synthase subunit gamma [Candidatus Levybacteria bacterium]